MTLKRSRALCTRYWNPAPYTGSPLTFGLDSAVVMFNKRTKFDGTEPVILAFHGHGGNGASMATADPYFAHELMELARVGWIVVCPDIGGGTGWPSPLIETIITACYTWATSAHDPAVVDFSDGLGGKPGKVELYGYSMGGGNAVTYSHNHPDRVAACIAINPAINLDVFASPEIDMLYAAFRATKTGGTQTINAVASTTQWSDTSGMPAAGFAVRLGSSGFSVFHYTGKDATHLTGCTASPSVTCSNNNIVSPYPSYTGHEGFNAHYDAAQGLYLPAHYAVPTRLYHGTADATVVPSTIAEFLTNAANAGIQEFPVAGGDHVTTFLSLGDGDNVSFLATYLN